MYVGRQAKHCVHSTRRRLSAIQGAERLAVKNVVHGRLTDDATSLDGAQSVQTTPIVEVALTHLPPRRMCILAITISHSTVIPECAMRYALRHFLRVMPSQIFGFFHPEPYETVKP